MKLTERTTEQMLNSTLLVCGGNFIQVTDTYEHAKHRSSERYSAGDLCAQLQGLIKLKDEHFVNEIQYEYAQCRFAFTYMCEQRILISVCESAPDNAKEDKRRQSVVVEQKPRKIEIDILAKQPLHASLLNLAREETAIFDNSHEALILLQCVGIFNILKVFAQFDLLTTDSLTKLQSRTALQRAIDDNNRISGVNLCMIHCRDFQVVNRKFGQAKGDQVLNEIAKIISQYTRSGDIACRFGGALFGIASHANSVQEGLALAQKIQAELHNRPYLQNAIRLSFNIGVAHLVQNENIGKDNSASSVVIQRAEQALKAAQTSDKPSIVHWEADKFSYDEQEFNHLGGIFTPDNVTNYRNMLLLWDISSIIADEHEFKRLLMNVIERLAYTFEFSCAGIVSTEQYSPYEQAIRVSEMADIEPLAFEQAAHHDLIRKSAHQAISSSHHLEVAQGNERLLLIPLGSELNACFFLLGDDKKLNLTHDSVMLIAGFARQIGKALKRKQLEEELNRNLEQQNAQLEQELHALKTNLQSSALVYRSSAMQEIVEQTQRAAQTDTTILVTGESGTGKEKLIHAIHSLSPRNKKPLVIVDCGAIPETLIESELFGYVKGAFTGAQSQSTGKIQAADGGILVLDEIGELPLSMQPKLLRFVQEKHYTPVGGNRSIDVDVKIVAVTNRDLAKEVELGRFRQDLYYRLNVVTLHNPPLRKRTEDLALLSQHFLAKFANQFETSRKYLSEHTLKQMERYRWPGNIRELENKLMQASLMCQGNEIQFADLNIASTYDDEADLSVAKVINLTVSNSPAEQHFASSLQSSSELKHIASAPVATTEVQSTADASDYGDSTQWLQYLTNALDALIAEIHTHPQYYQSEIGLWIEQSVMTSAMQYCKTNTEIAKRLQIPVSTARRKALKAKQQQFSEFPKAWAESARLLHELGAGRIKLASPLDYLQRLLLERILAFGPVNMTHAAQMLGVSEPTMYKIKRQLN